MKGIVMNGVREYAEDFDVELREYEGRLVIAALNEGGCNGTDVDLLDLIAWVKENKPELLEH